MLDSNRLIVFARYPEPGKAKTRLIPALGANGAAQLHRQMVEHTLVQVQQLQSAVGVEVRFTGSSQELMKRWLGDGLIYTIQGEGDLGERMSRSLQAAFNSGVQRVVIIGTDCPELDAPLLKKAFLTLEQHDLVLGVAADGGYYLIGLRRFVPELFVGIAWSTSDVLQQTVEIANRLELTIAYLPTLSDVDYPADLEIWYRVHHIAQA